MANKAGRPTKYKDEYCDQVYKLCLLGHTDIEIAGFFDVSVDTIHEWRKVHPEFSESTKRGKDIADGNVAESLYRRAVGYEHPEDKIFNSNGEALVVPTVKRYPPDTQAASLFLRNRQPKKWRDKQEIDHTTAGEKITQPQIIIGGKKQEVDE